MAELCEEFELHPTQINDWKRQLLERAADVFGSGTAPDPVDLAPLHAKIGQLALENDFLESRAHQVGVAERFSVVDREHPLSVARPAKLLDISRSAVYDRPRPISDADLALMRRIDERHLEHPFMGAPMLQRALARHPRGSASLERERVGIQLRCPQPLTSERHPQHNVCPYLPRIKNLHHFPGH